MMNNLTSRREFIRDLRRPILENIAPCYILDSYYQILDWNPSLHEILAKPFNLFLGMSATKVIDILANKNECLARSMKVFGFGKIPLVDHEPILIDHPKYGRIIFHKFAAQILTSSGLSNSWSVELNICHSDKFDDLSNDVMKRIESEIKWSIFISSLSQFHEYLSTNFYEQIKPQGTSALFLGTLAGNDISIFLNKFKMSSLKIFEFNETVRELLKMKLNSSSLKIEYIKDTFDRVDQLSDASVDFCVSEFGLNRVSQWEILIEKISQFLTLQGKFYFSILNETASTKKIEDFFYSKTLNLNVDCKKSIDSFIDNFKDLDNGFLKINEKKVISQLKDKHFKINYISHSWDGMITFFDTSKL